MKKTIKWTVFIIIVIFGAWAVATGRYTEYRIERQIKKGDKRMAQKDFMSALGCYEQAMGVDSTSAKAHLRAAIALDSLHRPVEAGWHYNDAKMYGGMKK